MNRVKFIDKLAQLSKKQIERLWNLFLNLWLVTGSMCPFYLIRKDMYSRHHSFSTIKLLFSVSLSKRSFRFKVREVLYIGISDYQAEGH